MATDIEQIFRTFVVNKIKEIQDEKFNNVKLESQTNGERKTSDQGKDSVDIATKVRSLHDEQIVKKIEQVLSGALEGEQVNPDTKDSNVMTSVNASVECISNKDSGIPKKKPKKHKKHKSRKKKKKKKAKKSERQPHLRSRSVSSSMSEVDSDSESRSCLPSFSNSPLKNIEDCGTNKVLPDINIFENCKPVEDQNLGVVKTLESKNETLQNEKDQSAEDSCYRTPDQVTSNVGIDDGQPFSGAISSLQDSGSSIILPVDSTDSTDHIKDEKADARKNCEHQKDKECVKDSFKTLEKPKKSKDEKVLEKSKRSRSKSPSRSKKQSKPSRSHSHSRHSPANKSTKSKGRSRSESKKRHASLHRKSRSLSRERRKHYEPLALSRRKRSRSESSKHRSHKHRSRSCSKSSRSQSVTQNRLSRSTSHHSRKRSRSRHRKKTRSRSSSRCTSSREKQKRSHRSRSSDRKHRSGSREHYSTLARMRYRSRSTDRRRRSRSYGRRRSFSGSPERRRRSKSPGRSRSPDHKKKSRSPGKKKSSSRSPKRLTELEKAQLLEIAKANAAAMCANGFLPLLPNLIPVVSLLTLEEKGAMKAGGNSIQELTEKCKQIVQSKEEEEEMVNKPHVSDEEEDHKFPSQPLKVNEPKPISFSLNNPTVKPALKNQATLTKEFPVSSGCQHRTKEVDSVYGVWVPVEKSTKQNNEDIFINTEPPQPVNISVTINDRAVAQKRLTENPFDVEAICILNRVQEQINAWAQSNSLPGQFTGSTGAPVLSSEELSNSGPQAWIRKDQFLKAAPVSGGMGAHLMRKMGWKEGEGLGKNKEGSVEPLIIDFKIDRKGLVAEGEKTQKKAGSFTAMKDLSGKHPVSALMEICNKRKWTPPEFALVHDSGPDHRKHFLFKVLIDGREHQPNFASPNKKHAKAAAATVALQAMGLVPKDNTPTATDSTEAQMTSDGGGSI